MGKGPILHPDRETIGYRQLPVLPTAGLKRRFGWFEFFAGLFIGVVIGVLFS